VSKGRLINFPDPLDVQPTYYVGLGHETCSEDVVHIIIRDSYGVVGYTELALQNKVLNESGSEHYF
jgi:hypothetical protein